MPLPLRNDGWPSIDPGELRFKLVIQRAIESQDATGALKQTWVTYAEVNSSMDPFGGGETWGDSALATTNLFKMKMHFIPRVTTKMRVQYDDPNAGIRTFDIKNVENVGEKSSVLILKCLERLYDEQGVRVQ
jgi:head-tail adaptor